MLKSHRFVVFCIVLVLFLLFLTSRKCTQSQRNFYHARLLGLWTKEQLAFTSYGCHTLPAQGRQFPANFIPFLKEWKISDFDRYEDAQFNSDDVIIVTYSSSNHFTEARIAIRELRKTFGNKIVFFDLGLRAEEVAELKAVCNLEVRHFNFSSYPEYVRRLKEYRFKPILIAEVFAEAKAFWVIDASIRFNGAIKALNEFYDSVISGEVESFVLRHPASHSIFAATDSGMFSYLPMDVSSSQSMTMLEANTMFVQQSEFAREVVKWNALCALTEDCMAPPNAQLNCTFAWDRYGTSAGCHRYDQSSVNVIVASLLERDGRNIDRDSGLAFTEFMSIARDTVMNETLHIPCPT